MASFLGQTPANTSEISKILTSWQEGPLVAVRADNSYNFSVYENYPMLKPLAFNLLAVPASSASSERLFSLMNRIQESTNNCLSDESFKKLTFLRANTTIMAAELERLQNNL